MKRWCPGLVLLALACESTPTGSERRGGGGSVPASLRLSCSIDTDLVYDGGVARNGIPALFNPSFVAASDPDAGYLSRYEALRRTEPFLPEIRVLGFQLGGQPVAIPFSVLWWHEIVNLDVGGRRVAFTLCPLTGSAMAFDLGVAGIDRFGVSGLVYQNNLMMFDVETESLWPQMSRAATCGPRSGDRLDVVPVVEMRWERWHQLHPNTLVVSEETGSDRNYDAYPYDLYESSDDFLLFPMDFTTLDRSRPLKERVLGLPVRDGGIGLPFGELQRLGVTGVVNVVVDNKRVVVLWDSVANAAMPYTTPAGTTLEELNGSIIDVETGSTWTVDGYAVSGVRQGERLTPAAGYVSFWFAWRAFQPAAMTWSGGG